MSTVVGVFQGAGTVRNAIAYVKSTTG
jgi:DNA invertase Pin-like site-specific DNA recombinase